MNDINADILNMSERKSIEYLKHKYRDIINHIESGEGCYIWGTGKLGKFCLEQLTINSIGFKGFIDNNQSVWDDKEIFPPEKIQKNDIVIVCSLYYPQIIMQLKELGNDFHIYYEEFAYIMDACETYYPAFDGIFYELEKNKYEYLNIFNVLDDKISKEIYADVLRHRMTLDHCYTVRALGISSNYGIQDFDELVVKRFTENTSFYDVGGFDGQSTLDFISHAPNYKKIYFFEPDKEILLNTQKRLKEFSKIEFLQVAIGNKTAEIGFDAVGGGSGYVSESGQEKVQMVCLDDYIHDDDCYVKFDVEGFELSALQGCEKAIRKYKPMLSVSVYHKPGDIHILINQILSWNPTYKVYMRHYTGTYADTRAYFIDK